MAAWTSGVLREEAVDLRYVRTGGSKPPLVLLHGLMANGACWSPLARALEDRFDVVMPDARGHGGSSAPLYGYRYEDHARDVLVLIRRLGLDAPVLLGHSMGGVTAAVVASERAAPARALILAEPTFISPQWQRDLRDGDIAEEHRRVLGMEKASVLVDLKARHPDRSAEILELLAEARLQTRMSALDVLTPPNPEFRELVRRIDVPTLLILGEKGVLSLEAVNELKAIDSRIHIERIEGAGHGVHYDRPARFEAIVRSFLDPPE